MVSKLSDMYLALSLAHSQLNKYRHTGQGSPYWGPEGMGGRTMKAIDKILEPLHKEYDQRSISRSAESK